MEHRTHRHWFLTWRTYGTWLPGDDRGFVGAVVGPDGDRALHNLPGTPTEPANPPLRAYARSRMSGGSILLDPEHAAELFAQFRETAVHRGWELLAVAVTPTHVQLVVEVEGDPDGADVLRDFKSYAGRRLNRVWGRCPGGSWWSESGSRRVLRDDGNVARAVEYVAGQSGAWLVWYRPHRPGGASPGERPV